MRGARDEGASPVALSSSLRDCFPSSPLAAQPLSAVPEPSRWSLFGVGCAALGCVTLAGRPRVANFTSYAQGSRARACPSPAEEGIRTDVLQVSKLLDAGKRGAINGISQGSMGRAPD